MKTGAIIYIPSSERFKNDFNIVQALKKLNIKADMVEVVSDMFGHVDVMDAWWLLLTKGMSNITCLTAQVEDGLELRLTGRQLRLCG